MLTKPTKALSKKKNKKLTDKIKIDDWSIETVPLDIEGTKEKLFAPILCGFIDGKKKKTDIVLWLDVKNCVAMTGEKIYELGQPDMMWYTVLTNNGYTLNDMSIKDTIH
jgi:hypothetical protein